MGNAKMSTELETAEKAEGIERQKLKEKLLKSLENVASAPSGGTSTENALSIIRQRELNYLRKG